MPGRGVSPSASSPGTKPSVHPVCRDAHGLIAPGEVERHQLAQLRRAHRLPAALWLARGNEGFEQHIGALAAKGCAHLRLGPVTRLVQHQEEQHLLRSRQGHCLSATPSKDAQSTTGRQGE